MMSTPATTDLAIIGAGASGLAAARPGEAHQRAVLAADVEERLFFAGEAASAEFYSTVHGAYFSGVDAAQKAAGVFGCRG